MKPRAAKGNERVTSSGREKINRVERGDDFAADH
ncbi:MAG: hypothetical protein QOD12_3039 [Verrucomicrobiota bacterium]|jgi:hypothetical protein